MDRPSTFSIRVTFRGYDVEVTSNDIDTSLNVLHRLIEEGEAPGRNIRRRLFPNDPPMERAHASMRRFFPNEPPMEQHAAVQPTHTVRLISELRGNDEVAWFYGDPLIRWMDIMHDAECMSAFSEDNGLEVFLTSEREDKLQLTRQNGFMHDMNECPVCMSTFELTSFVFVFGCNNHGVCMDCYNGMVRTMLKKTNPVFSGFDRTQNRLKLKCPICNDEYDEDFLIVPFTINGGNVSMANSHAPRQEYDAICIGMMKTTGITFENIAKYEVGTFTDISIPMFRYIFIKSDFM
jgi:hypothetical protein